MAFRLGEGAVPVRFAVTRMDDQHYRCEFGLIERMGAVDTEGSRSIFRFVPRKAERTEAFNAVFLVPTGVGAETAPVDLSGRIRATAPRLDAVEAEGEITGWFVDAGGQRLDLRQPARWRYGRDGLSLEGLRLEGDGAAVLTP